MAKRVSVINFKGGVGKTTLVMHLACGLERFHEASVLLIDIDHQSSLSDSVMGADPWEQAVNAGATSNAIFKSYTDRNVAVPDDSIIVKAPFDSSYPNLDIVPASLELDDTEIDLGATFLGDATKSMWEKLTLLCSWIDQHQLDKRYDYIIFDCPPATKLITRNAIAASQGYIVPVIPDTVSTRGLPHLVGLLDSKIDHGLRQYASDMRRRKVKLPKSYAGKTKLAGIVMSIVREHGAAATGFQDEDTRVMGNLARGTLGSNIVKPHVPLAAGVRSTLSAGWPVYDRKYDRNVSNRNLIPKFRRLTDTLKARIDAL